MSLNVELRSDVHIGFLQLIPMGTHTPLHVLPRTLVYLSYLLNETGRFRGAQLWLYIRNIWETYGKYQGPGSVPRHSDSVGDGKEPGISIFKSFPGSSNIGICSPSENNCPGCREGILCQFFSKYEPWTSSVTITLRLVRNAKFWSTPQNYRMGNSVVGVRPAVCGLVSLPGDSEACSIWKPLS